MERYIHLVFGIINNYIIKYTNVYLIECKYILHGHPKRTATKEEIGIQAPGKRGKKFGERERNKSGKTERFGQLLIPLTGFTVLLLFMTVPGEATEPTVFLTGYEVTPAVLMPGDMGTITFTISHTAPSASETEHAGLLASGIYTSTRTTGINVFIENCHLEGNGIVVLTEDFDRLGELGPGQSVPVTFVIRAPEISGIFFPEAWVDVQGGRSTRYPIAVNVNTSIATQKKPALSVSRILPDRVAPGERCEAIITLENTGMTRAGDIWVEVKPGADSLVLTTPGRYYIEHLEPGERSVIALQFATDRNTPIGLDLFNLDIMYQNPDGTVVNQTETVAIPIKGRADIAISSVTTDPVRPDPGSVFTLIVRVENTGTDRATSVRATLDSPFTGTKDAFIGSIEKNGDAPAIFDLQATKDGTVPVNLTLRYNDDFGSHAVSEHAAIMTRPASGIPLAVIVILVICIGGGVMYWYIRIRPGKVHA